MNPPTGPVSVGELLGYASLELFTGFVAPPGAKTGLLSRVINKTAFQKKEISELFEIGN